MEALGVIGPSRSVMKTCEDSPCLRCRRRSARISSPCIGWTFGEPFFALRTCSRPVTLFGRIGARAKMQFPIHPHMLRHGCGYALANAGHDTRALQAWLGHRNIQHTVRYTELAPDRFKDFWRD